jgi:hypothetical protein
MSDLKEIPIERNHLRPTLHLSSQSLKQMSSDFDDYFYKSFALISDTGWPSD